MEVEQLIALLSYGAQLKQTIRTGWMQRGVPQPESVAAHTFGVVYIALTLAPLLTEPIDLGELLALATLHDLPEALTSDLPSPVEQFFPADAPVGLKHAIERAALQRITNNAPAAGQWRAWWESLHAQATPEARLVHDADKIDLYLQAWLYEEQSGNRRLAEFWHTPPHLHYPVSQAIYAVLRGRREAL